MQALVRIQNHCKKVNMQNILKPCEIYFHHVIHTDLFPYVCAKNRHLDVQLNKKILTANSDSANSADLNLAPELKATLPGAKGWLISEAILILFRSSITYIDQMTVNKFLFSLYLTHKKIKWREN